MGLAIEKNFHFWKEFSFSGRFLFSPPPETSANACSTALPWGFEKHRNSIQVIRSKFSDGRRIIIKIEKILIVFWKNAFFRPFPSGGNKGALTARWHKNATRFFHKNPRPPKNLEKPQIQKYGFFVDTKTQRTHVGRERKNEKDSLGGGGTPQKRCCVFVSPCGFRSALRFPLAVSRTKFNPIQKQWHSRNREN